MDALLAAVDRRKKAKFTPKARVELQHYDCVSFAASIYEELQVLPEGSSLGDYQVYSRGDAMLKAILDWVEESRAFTESEKLKPGALLVVTRKTGGHHVGIYLGEGLVAHCAKFVNVQVVSFEGSFFATHLTKIFLPHGME